METIPNTVSEAKNLRLEILVMDPRGKPPTIILINEHSTKMPPNNMGLCL